MKKSIFSSIYLIALPYLVLTDIGVIIHTTELDKVSVIIMLVISTLLCMIGVAACIMCNLASLRKVGAVGSAVRNLVIKLLHLPIHLFIILLVLGLLNPFLFYLSWIPALCGGGVLVLSASANISSCVSLVARKKVKLWAGILLCVCSYILVIDIICAIIQLVIAKKSERSL